MSSEPMPMCLKPGRATTTIVPSHNSESGTSLPRLYLRTGYFHAQVNNNTPVLQKFANVHCNCGYAPPRRAFDFYTAVALVNLISSVCLGSDANLFFDGIYGIALVSKKPNYADAVDEYSSRINVAPAAGDNLFIWLKKIEIKTELGILNNKTSCAMIRVRSVEFDDV